MTHYGRRALTAEPQNLSLISWTHMEEGEKTQLPQVVLSSQAVACTHSLSLSKMHNNYVCE